MKVTISLVLFILAIICFVLAALKVPAMIDFTNAGYAFVVAGAITA